MTTIYAVDNYGNKKGDGLFIIESGKLYDVDSYGTIKLETAF